MSIAEAPKQTAPEIKQTQCFIGGEWVDAASGETFETMNPATEEIIANVAAGDAEDIDRAAKAARKAFDSGPWSKMDARDRGRLMYKLADLFEDNFDELAALETLDNGKPISDSRNADLPLVIDCLRYYAGWADKIEGKTIPIRGNYMCYTRSEPVGVAGQIIPWNFPMLMAAWKWGPALAAGCTIVMKPAEQTPLTCLRMADLAQEAGFPDGVINIVPGYGPTAGAAVVDNPLIDKVAFTGSTEVGKMIMKNAAQSLKRVTLELGGKSPNLIFADADLEQAAQGAFIGLYLNQGQCCVACSRIFVEDDIHDQMVDKLVGMSKERKVGDPFDPSTEQGPQIDKTQFDKILGYIESGKSEGATCLTGGGRQGDRGYYIQPTVFTDVKDDMKIAREEIFGPVMQIMKFSDIDEVVKRGNTTEYGLAASVFTRDVAKAHKAAATLKAGTVWVNCYDVFDAAAPFGGFKQSGLGRELGEAALSNYIESKTVTMSLD
ncbi:aldehyde dehydrogenase family protein [Stratiformator vulcanicus]|uniref:NAD/NADP-dependent betaine aldehyde dehydrogenase n=1 Tax=Stratiformator vulcanicus TaxID=2527980 RepID=A0A517R1A9_9PLAN|nr:aldehyde dehydrogenase family protein [Stratiformator vulcanicus]QDT37661.1 NAD/NADP-dependent betaine aldehyde dehydrogenase [Stratiformator vulcanicus]